MSESETLSALIADVYDAALDPARWPEVMGQAARFLPGLSAAIFVKDAVNRSGNVYYDDGGIDPHYKQLYFEKYVKIDPANAAHFLTDIEIPISITDIMPYEEFVETRFYKEWVQPQGIADFISVQLERSATSAALFGIFRHEMHGLVDGEAKRRMTLLAPHVRRAALIGKVMDLKAYEIANFADALNGLTTAMFLVDARGQIVHANSAGCALVADGDVLHAVLGRLTASDLRTTEALNDIFASAGSGDAGIGIKGIAVPLKARRGDQYIAHVLPLTSGARRKAGAAYCAIAAVFVRQTRLEPPAMPEIIARLYGLTPGELRVLLAVFETGGVADIAGMLGIAEGTAKTHLRRLFDKTGTRRQADLVKLVAGFASAHQ